MSESDTSTDTARARTESAHAILRKAVAARADAARAAERADAVYGAALLALRAAGYSDRAVAAMVRNAVRAAGLPVRGTAENTVRNHIERLDEHGEMWTRAREYLDGGAE